MKERHGHVWLAVNSDGISVCDQNDKTAVIITYYWAGVRKCSYRYKKLVIELMDPNADNVTLSASDFSICKQIKWLCNNYKNFFTSIWHEPDMIVQLIRQQVEDEADRRRKDEEQ